MTENFALQSLRRDLAVARDNFKVYGDQLRGHQEKTRIAEIDYKNCKQRIADLESAIEALGGTL